jgi:hypothetical protein
MKMHSNVTAQLLRKYHKRWVAARTADACRRYMDNLLRGARHAVHFYERIL